MTDQQQEEYSASVQENIRELKKDKEKLTDIQVTLDDFFRGYNVVPLLVGTMIGTALVYIVKSLSDEIIGPLLHTFILSDITTVELIGTKFNVANIISAIVFVILSVAVLYAFLILFLRQNIQITILNQKNDEIDKQNALLNTSRYQRSNIRLLSQIKKLLAENAIKYSENKLIKNSEEST